MVDVSAKSETQRRAVAVGEVALSREAARLVRANAIAKGDVLSTARLAGIQAAKKTAEWIPLCHPLRLDAIDVRVENAPRARVAIRAEVRARDALTAVAAAALTVYDMTKAVDKGARIESVRLLAKDGGRSGSWRATATRRRRRGETA
jgi:cyclic pyranopterin phosphate synthase